MSTTGMVNLQNAPRDVENLLSIKRGIRYRLGLQIQMFSDNTAEQGFLSASDEDQSQALSVALQQYDANGQATPIAAQPMQQATPQQAAPAMPPQLMQPQVPMNMPIVGQQPVMPPAAPQPQAPMMPQPQMPQQLQLPAQPVMAPQPQLQPPPQPVTAPQPQHMVQPMMAPPVPLPQPVTSSDPTNTGSSLGTSIPQKLSGILKAIRQVVEVSESTQAWIEEVHDHALGNSRVLETLLLLQLVIAEHTGMDQDILVKLMLSKAPGTVEEFLRNFSEEEEPGEE